MKTKAAKYDDPSKMDDIEILKDMRKELKKAERELVSLRYEVAERKESLLTEVLALVNLGTIPVSSLRVNEDSIRKTLKEPATCSSVSMSWKDLPQ